MIHLAFAAALALPLAFGLGRTLGQRQILRDQRTLRRICRARL